MFAFARFTRLTCSEKCVVDYHPWCWKVEKERDGGSIDKDYLSRWCKTPDCNAPISKIEIVRDDISNPVVISDNAVTEKMLEEMERLTKKQLVISEPHVLEDMKAKEDEMQQRINELTKQLQESKAVEKNLNRQLRIAVRDNEESQATAKNLQEVSSI